MREALRVSWHLKTQAVSDTHLRTCVEQAPSENNGAALDSALAKKAGVILREDHTNRASVAFTVLGMQWDLGLLHSPSHTGTTTSSRVTLRDLSSFPVLDQAISSSPVEPSGF